MTYNGSDLVNVSILSSDPCSLWENLLFVNQWPYPAITVQLFWQHLTIILLSFV